MRHILNCAGRWTAVAAIGVGAALAASPGLRAQELTIGFGAAVTSMDPHYHNLGPNNMLALHVFDALVHQDERQKLVPGLAESWKPLDATTWEFKLRKGVKFHDGSDFDAQDVVATIKRAPNVPNSPSSFKIYLSAIKDVVVVDPHTVRFVTAAPAPLVPNEISSVAIVSRKSELASSADFNGVKAAVGTGPFKLVEYVQGERIAYARNERYWGGQPSWAKVTYKIITNPGARVAALRAGDVQAITDVPTADIAGLKRLKELNVVSAPSNRVIYLHMDHQRDASPFVFEKGSNKPLAKNPLKDQRVRKAMSMAINRQAIADRVMEGNGIPAGQFLPDGFFGTSKTLKPEKFDPEAAKKLLVAAGYPNGFGITLHGPSDRYINDEKVLQAVAQMYTRIGIEAKVEAIPWATYIGRASKQEFSQFLVGWGAATGETSSPLRSLLATFDAAKGFGPGNRGRYSNPEMDRLLDQALSTVNDAERDKLLAKACEIAVADLGIIPLHYEVSTWAMKANLAYTGRADQYTLAQFVKPRK